MRPTHLAYDGGEVHFDVGARVAVVLAQVLRASGVSVPGDGAIVFAQALAEVDWRDGAAVYWAGRATLTGRPEDSEIFDAAFCALFGRGPAGSFLRPVPVRVAVATDDPGPEQANDEGDGAEHGEIESEDEPPDKVVELRYSAVEILRHKDFAVCTPDELVEAQRLMASTAWHGATRRTRRRRPSRRRGSWPDMRATVRRSLRTGGEPMGRRWLEPGDRLRRIVFLCDVSGSMAPYARALMRFLQVTVAGRGRVEVFTIGTRLTRVTRALRSHDPDEALASVARAVPDWSGGTRLGESLHRFNEEWASRGVGRGADVVVLSDGWDRGDPALLGSEMARLRRVANRIIWVNPLKATPGYEPLVRGMAAALPHVDRFVAGHSVESLQALAGLLSDGPVPERSARIEPLEAA